MDGQSSEVARRSSAVITSAQKIKNEEKLRKPSSSSAHGFIMPQNWFASEKKQPFSILTPHGEAAILQKLSRDLIGRCGNLKNDVPTVKPILSSTKTSTAEFDNNSNNSLTKTASMMVDPRGLVIIEEQRHQEVIHQISDDRRAQLLPLQKDATTSGGADVVSLPHIVAHDITPQDIPTAVETTENCHTTASAAPSTPTPAFQRIGVMTLRRARIVEITSYNDVTDKYSLVVQDCTAPQNHFHVSECYVASDGRGVEYEIKFEQRSYDLDGSYGHSYEHAKNEPPRPNAEAGALSVNPRCLVSMPCSSETLVAVARYYDTDRKYTHHFDMTLRKSITLGRQNHIITDLNLLHKAILEQPGMYIKDRECSSVTSTARPAPPRNTGHAHKNDFPEFYYNHDHPIRLDSLKPHFQEMYDFIEECIDPKLLASEIYFLARYMAPKLLFYFEEDDMRDLSHFMIRDPLFMYIQGRPEVGSITLDSFLLLCDDLSQAYCSPQAIASLETLDVSRILPKRLFNNTGPYTIVSPFYRTTPVPPGIFIPPSGPIYVPSNTAAIVNNTKKKEDKKSVTSNTKKRKGATVVSKQTKAQPVVAADSSANAKKPKTPATPTNELSSLRTMILEIQNRDHGFLRQIKAEWERMIMAYKLTGKRTFAITGGAYQREALDFLHHKGVVRVSDPAAEALKIAHSKPCNDDFIVWEDGCLNENINNHVRVEIRSTKIGDPYRSVPLPASSEPIRYTSFIDRSIKRFLSEIYKLYGSYAKKCLKRYDFSALCGGATMNTLRSAAQQECLERTSAVFRSRMAPRIKDLERLLCDNPSDIALQHEHAYLTVASELCDNPIVLLDHLSPWHNVLEGSNMVEALRAYCDYCIGPEEARDPQNLVKRKPKIDYQNGMCWAVFWNVHSWTPYELYRSLDHILTDWTKSSPNQPLSKRKWLTSEVRIFVLSDWNSQDLGCHAFFEPREEDPDDKTSYSCEFSSMRASHRDVSKELLTYFTVEPRASLPFNTLREFIAQNAYLQNYLFLIPELHEADFTSLEQLKHVRESSIVRISSLHNWRELNTFAAHTSVRLVLVGTENQLLTLLMHSMRCLPEDFKTAEIEPEQPSAAPLSMQMMIPRSAMTTWRSLEEGFVTIRN